jgi:hypothetical protein
LALSITDRVICSNGFLKRIDFKIKKNKSEAAL